MALTLSWNEELMGRLETLYRTGLSFRDIADTLSVSRNAVIGKVHRMNLPRRTEAMVVVRKPEAPRAPRIRIRVPVVTKPKPAPEPEPEVESNAAPCSLIMLTDATCRYPLWNGGPRFAERMYCGSPTARMSAGQPYCQKHARLCNPQR